jgi:hypothetical protein
MIREQLLLSGLFLPITEHVSVLVVFIGESGESASSLQTLIYARRTLADLLGTQLDHDWRFQTTTTTTPVTTNVKKQPKWTE